MIVIVTFVILDLFHHQYHLLHILLHPRETLQQFRCHTRIHVIQAPLAQAMVY